ncbi:hypothetical protein TrLO_g11894 [Triparma laevis f. longispina]|uniref:Fatty acid desaturase domain-containing protein n=1 Tax=Triparma laevis f. longispina TaxID=1714387 RepID=A0A9W7AVE8_9STRA|nr:hypothetical protein TrLO_g11894 [Triparma laevis f. longispina]
MCQSKNAKPANAPVNHKGFKSDGTHWASSYDPHDKSVALPSKAQIKASIPKECFERSAVHSMYFVLRDTCWAVLCVYLAHTFLSTTMPAVLSTSFVPWFVGWNLYAFWMGTILTGHWVLAHECGHNAFSTSKTINDCVGYVLHQALLVPYFAWQYSHAKHHRRTNNLVDGESHVPSTREENGVGPNLEKQSHYAWLHEMMGDGFFAGFQIFTHLVIGWPIYLAGFASTGRIGADGKPLGDDVADHYRPFSRMFPSRIRHKIFASTIGVVGLLAYLTKLSFDHGFLPVALYYWGPYMWTNAWLVLYTWLQHNDPSVPQYGEDEWTWVKGALSTIDRPYYIFDYFHHKIGSTHVAHHLFHEMPFYKADVATKAVKEFLGPLYNYDPTPFPIAMWRVASTCHYVDSVEGIQYPRSINDCPPGLVKPKKA